MRRIVYIQYTNPAAYPPLIHSSNILAEKGWQVLFLGITAHGAAEFSLPSRARIDSKRLGEVSGGGFGSLKYAAFAGRVLLEMRRFRANWCYASDSFSAPIALACRKLLRSRVLYHEHDAPPLGRGPRMRIIANARQRLAASADVVVAPSRARLECVPRGSAKRFVVWNCPRLSEVAPERTAAAHNAFRMVYVGSLSRDRLTPQFVDALTMLPQHIELHVFGYETQGHRGYANYLKDQARVASVAARFFHHGSMPGRSELLHHMRAFDLGIATIDQRSADPNLQTLAGASNKAFDYLAAGMPLLVGPQEDWQELFVAPGYAIACDPTDATSITQAVLTLANARARARAMGEAGRQRILAEWNYESQFAPVLAALER